MDRKDLSIEHGNNNYDPNFGSAFFTTIDGLNHLTNKDGYNEVAGWRKNMRPCAIALMEDEPTEEQIKAAQYFNIPLVKLKKHIKSEQYAYLDTFEEYTKNLDSKTLSNFIFDNISESDNLMEKYRSRIDNVISFLLNSLKYTINISRSDEMDFLHRAILEQNKENLLHS